jgi:shikimate kinase
VATSRPSRVFLLGMMGSGKTAVGRALAHRLGWRYRDNDQQLQVTAGASVDAVAASFGRERLHMLEAEQAGLAAGEPPPVVAGLAASVVEDSQLWPTLRAAGWCVYLRARPETLVARVGTGEGRPWLAADQGGFVERTLRQRGSLYAELADVVINVDDRGPHQIAADIIELLHLEAVQGP